MFEVKCAPQMSETHTDTDWKNLAMSAPDRIVAALRLGTLSQGSPARNDFGDGPSAVYPAMISAAAIALKNGDAWDALVDAGVVDALCQLVIGAVPGYGVLLPDSTEEDIPAPWYDPLSVFFYYFTLLGHSVTPTSLKMIPTLRRNWTQMMKRIWDEPGTSIKLEKKYAFARLVVGALFDSIVDCDPSFYSVIYDPFDRTIAVVSRFWTCSTDPDVDIKMNTLALMKFLNPDSGDERNISPLIFRRVLEGAPTPHSSASFLACLVSHFNLPGVNAEHADVLLNVLYYLYHSMFTQAHMDEWAYAAKGRRRGVRQESGGDEGQHTDFLTALCIGAQPLWRTLFTLSIKHLQPPENLPPKKDIFAIRVMDVIGTALLHSSISSQVELCDLVRTLVRAGLFQTLDDTISFMFTAPNMHEKLSWIILYVHTACATGIRQSEIKRLVGAELPRPRILRATYDQCHDSRGFSLSPSFEINHPLIYDMRKRKQPWTHLRALELDVMDPTKCGRRGCQNKIAVRCAVCKLGYCGQDCQKSNLEEHDLFCGLKDD